MEPRSGIHIIAVNSTGEWTKYHNQNKPVAMWIVTLSNGDTAFLSLEKTVLKAIGCDMITVETMIEELATRFCSPTDMTAVKRVLHARYEVPREQWAGPSLAVTEARQRLEHQIRTSRMVADARNAERGDLEPGASGGDDYAE